MVLIGLKGAKIKAFYIIGHMFLYIFILYFYTIFRGLNSSERWCITLYSQLPKLPFLMFFCCVCNAKNCFPMLLYTIVTPIVSLCVSLCSITFYCSRKLPSKVLTDRVSLYLTEANHLSSVL